jgi:hypothetical protein
MAMDPLFSSFMLDRTAFIGGFYENSHDAARPQTYKMKTRMMRFAPGPTHENTSLIS